MSENVNKRVIIVAPIGRDAIIMAALINDNGVSAEVCPNLQECCKQIASGVGVLLFTEEALGDPHVPELLNIFKNQPPWSEIPLIILTSVGNSNLVKLLDMTAKAAGSLMLLERPIGAGTLMRSVEVALHSRTRQYQVRDLLEEQANVQKDLVNTNEKLQELSHELEIRVEERTAQLLEQTEQLRHLAVELTEIEEAERKRLAQVLHDQLQQLLVAAKIRLQMLERKAGSLDKEALTDIGAFLQQAYDSSRSLTAELRPPVLYESGLVAALRFLARKFEDQHHLKVHLNISDDAEPTADFFKTVIYHAVQELLFNAVKYSGVRECTLKLNKADKKIRVVLIDEGVGFNPEDIGRRGTGGFGLFSIRERMKALGAEFNIKSSLGNGAIFEMIIPDFDEAEEQSFSRGTNKNNKKRKSRKGYLRVLIVDDHKIVRQSLAQVLLTQPFIDEVIEAQDGRDAIAKVEEHHPDVVIMDLNMPHMNGMEATRHLHKIHPKLKIIGLSVQPEMETAQAMKKAGAIEYFNKNTDTSILVETLKHLSKLEF